MALPREAGAGQLVMFHHDPWRSDEQIDALLAHARNGSCPGDGLTVTAAYEGLVIDLGAARS